jgi:HEAT repeat protein
LGAIGPDAAKAVPELAKLAAGEGDDLVADLATQALGEIKSAAVPTLIQLLHRGSPEARVRIINALGEAGSTAAAAIPDLVRARAGSDEEIRTAAAEALGKLGYGPEAAVAIPRLIEILKDPDRHVRKHAAKGLGEIGTKSDQVIPALMGAMRDRDSEVKNAASEALEVIGMPALPALRALLRDGDNELSDDAARILAQIASVKPYNRSEDETDQQARARFQAAPSALFAALKDPDERTRAGAAQALGYVGKEIVPDLVKALEDRSPLVRLQAVRALGFIGAEASPALDPVRSRLRDRDPDVRRAAEATIKAILKPDP